MDQQKAFGRITRRVAIDRSILTYRLAARELGCTVTDAKATLQAYFESDVAKERNVGAVWLVSGFLVPPSRAPLAPNGTQARDDDDAMDVDSSAEVGASAAAQGTQERGGAGEGDGVGEVVQRIVQRLVQNKDLEAQLPLFASTPRPPSTHLYALLPAPSLPDLALLGPAALSLVAPASRDKWRAPPAAEDEDAAQGPYGELVHPDGERRRVKGAAGRAAGAGASASTSAAKGKGKAPVAAAKKEDEDEDDKPVVADVGGNKAKGAKAKGADSKAKDKKASKKDADKDKDKAKGPTSRPIGQLGGLFSRKFDEPPPKKAKGNKGKGKGKGKGKAASSDSDSDSDSDGDASGASSDDAEPAPPPKSKKVVPAKRKSSSPVVTRTKAASSPAKVAPNKTKKAPDVVLDGDDGDEFDDWAMDEEALLEAERAAEQQAATRKTSAAAGASASASGSAGAGKAKESKADRQKRELEEMMQSDDTMDIDSKPSRSNLSRTPSTSSAAPTKPKPKASSSSSSGGGTAQQKGLGAFFKKK